MRKGGLLVSLCYLMWGLLPVYFNLVDPSTPLETLAHRIVWSLLFLVAILIARRGLVPFIKSIDKKTLRIYLISGLMLLLNWGTFVWAMAADRIVEASLGYFINPLVSVLLGVIILKEKLRVGQWLAIGIAAIGVLYMTIASGVVPWVSLILALTFGLYGLIKKLAPLGTVQGLTLETAVVFLPAAGYLIWLFARNESALQLGYPVVTVSLLAAGMVTAVPLLLFSAGAKLIPLTMVGILQYIGPTLQFLLGVFVFHEPLSAPRLTGFVVIWAALILFTVESLLHYRATHHPAQPHAEPYKVK